MIEKTSRIRDWKRETLICRRNWSGLHAKGYKNYTQKEFKNKNSGGIEHLPWTTIAGMDGWEIVIPSLICLVKQSKEKYITLIQVCISIKS